MNDESFLLDSLFIDLSTLLLTGKILVCRAARHAVLTAYS